MYNNQGRVSSKNKSKMMASKLTNNSKLIYSYHDNLKF
jgi:hypothetical protein